MRKMIVMAFAFSSMLFGMNEQKGTPVSPKTAAAAQTVTDDAQNSNPFAPDATIDESDADINAPWVLPAPGQSAPNAMTAEPDADVNPSWVLPAPAEAEIADKTKKSGWFGKKKKENSKKKARQSAKKNKASSDFGQIDADIVSEIKGTFGSNSNVDASALDELEGKNIYDLDFNDAAALGKKFLKQ